MKKRRKQTRVVKVSDLARLQREIEQQIFMADEEELQLLAPLYLNSSYNILVAFKGKQRTRDILQDFVNKIDITELEKIP